MRSFSKKLAFVLAAAMVVTAFAPAAKAEAAKEMAINKQGKILYVTDGKGINDAAQVGGGKGNVSSYDFAVSNKPANWKSDYTFAWSSSDEDVITVKDGGLTTAVGVGKADVVCVVTEKATGKATTLKNTVTVKANAADVVITNADDYANTAVEVGDVVDLNRAMYDANGTKAPKRGVVVTDYTRWMVEPATGVKVDSTKGTFEFTDAAEAGEYKLWCETYQSNKYKATTAKSDVVKVELVKGDEVTAVQKSATKLSLEFGSALKSLAVADVTVNRMVGDYAYTQVVRSAVLSKDGKTADVELFGSFINGVTYTVTVKGLDEVSFVASVGAPTSMVVVADGKNPANILTTGAAATLKCYFYDKNGVDVTSAEYEKLVSYKLEKTAPQGEYILSNNRLTIKKDSVSAVVIANYRGKFENGKVVGALEAKEVFYAVDTPAVYPVGVNMVDLNENFGDGSQTTIQIKETNKPLWLKLALSNGKELEVKNFSDKNNWTQFTVNNNGANERITVTPVTPEVADIANGKIVANKAGTAVFYVNYGTKANNVWTDVPFATVQVNVLENAYFNSISVNNKNFTVSTSDVFMVDGQKMSSNDYFAANADKQVWELPGGIQKRVGLSQNYNDILTYDQRGSRYSVAAGTNERVVVKCLSEGYGNDYKAADLSGWPYISVYFSNSYWADGKSCVSFNVDGAMIKNYLVKKGLFDAADNGQYISLDYEVTIKNDKYADVKDYFTVTVQEPTAGADNEYLEVTTSSTYVDISRYSTPNVGWDNAEAEKSVSFEVFKKSNGVTVDTVTVAPFNKETATPGVYQYKILKDGQEITTSANVTAGKTNGWPYSAAQELVNQNKVNIRLSGTSVDGNLYTALGVTSGAWVPNYYDKGAGSYTFALYQWYKDADTDTLYEVQVHQSDVTAVFNGTGAYSIDMNAQLKNSVTVTGDYRSDALAIMKCFTFKNRDGKNVLKTDNGVDYYFDGNYTYYVNYNATANYVYVKEVVFYENLGNGVYAPYVVTVDTSLVKN